MKKWLTLFTLVVFANTYSAQNTIVTDTILQLSTCAGGNVIVPFEATGNFPFGNVFTAQLSDPFGQFTNPIDIGSVPLNLGFILATIPANTNFGFLYKVRVVSTNPAVIGDPCPNTLIITQVAQLNQILAAPNDTACIGDTITLTAINPANSYAWSTGDTTASIEVNQAGLYSVTTTDFLNCESDTSINVYFEMCNVGLEENMNFTSFSIFPNPSKGEFTVVDSDLYNGNYDLKVIDQLGKVVFEKAEISDASFSLYLGKAGMYFLEIKQGNYSTRRKLIVQ